MAPDVMNVSANEFKQLVNEVNLIKKVLLNNRIVFDSEGILNDEVVKEIENAQQRISNGEFITNEEMLREFNIE